MRATINPLMTNYTEIHMVINVKEQPCLLFLFRIEMFEELGSLRKLGNNFIEEESAHLHHIRILADILQVKFVGAMLIRTQPLAGILPR